VSDRPPLDSDATDDLDAFCDLPEFEVRSVSPQRTATRPLRETSRVEAFSDGVFAIAITLLEQWPTYVAFVMSFLSILITWASHHDIFSLIRRVDHVFLLLNGLVLMGVTLVPSPPSSWRATSGTRARGWPRRSTASSRSSSPWPTTRSDSGRAAAGTCSSPTPRRRR